MNQDWDEVETLRASLREHMAEIKRLNKCLIWEQHRAEHIGTHGPSCAMWGPKHYECLLRAYDAAMNTLRAALAEEQYENTVQSTGGVHSCVSYGTDSGMGIVTDCHEKEGDKLSLPFDRSAGSGKTSDAPETNFGDMSQVFDPTEDDHIPDATKMVDPVAWMVYTLDGQSAFVTDNPADFTPQHRALPLYTAPPKREPLASEELRSIQEHQRLLEELGPVWAPMLYYFCRAIERAHGIGGKE